MIGRSPTLIYCMFSLLVLVLLGAAVPAEARPHRTRHTDIRRHAKRSTNWTYLGCAYDASSRALHGYTYSSTTAMTVEDCISTCDSKGYTLAGLESKVQCFCGNSIVNNLGKKLDSSKCNQPCPGDASETCGGSWALSLYKKPGSTTSVVPSGWTSLGCSTDGSSRALKGYHYVDNSGMTVEACLSTCKGMNFEYAGVESTVECYCGSTLANSLGTPVSDQTRCSAICPGNIAESCGGTWLLNLYSSGSASTSTSTSKAATSTSTSKAATSTVTTSTSKAATSTTTSKAATSTVTTSTSKAATSTSTSKAATSTVTTSTSKAATSTSTSKAATSTVTTSTSKAATSTSTSKAATSTATTATSTSKVTSSTTTTKANSTTTSKASSTTTGASASTSKAASSTSTTASATSCNAACTSTAGVATPPSSKSTKTVYAHHMVGNTYSYTQATWADDIAQAKAGGIDGFALNYGSDSWQVPHIKDAYTAAAAAGFKLFLSLDVTSLSCSSAADAATHAGTIGSVASSSAQAMYKGAALVGTFSGDSCTFGQGSVSAGWAYLRSLLNTTANGNTTIYLVPAIFSDPSTFSTSNDWLDGELNWNSAWPMSATPLDTSRDTQYMQALGNKTYMPTISPEFFTYYGPNTYNKDWIYRGDDWLLARRWEQLIAMRDSVDMVELLTWNDYGESHYVGPIRADQPNSQGWTTGMPHTAWLGLVKYYSQAFKTGSYPAASDAIYLWSRPHAAAATATAPSNPKPSGWDYTDDNLYAVVVLSASSNVSLSAGNHTGTWTLPAGLSKLSIASAPGAIGLNVTRSGTTIKSYNSTGSFSWVQTPSDYNFNYFVASA